MSTYPDLTKMELREMDIIIDSIHTNPTSPKSLSYREQFFVPKQKLAKVRYFFSVVKCQLTDKELEVVRSIIIKPNSSEWSVISRIIRFQQQLSEEQVMEWFEAITPLNRNAVALTIITDSRVKDVDYKVNLAKNLLKHVNHRRPLLLNMDIHLVDGFEWWDKIFDLVIETINGDDGEVSDNLISIWKVTKNLGEYALKKKAISLKLYQRTGDERYLPSAAKDIFMF